MWLGLRAAERWQLRRIIAQANVRTDAPVERDSSLALLHVGRSGPRDTVTPLLV